MTPRILVTGATGQVGREVVAQLSAAGRPVRALTRNPNTAGLPAAVEVVGGDLSAPETLDRALDDVAAVFLVWVAPGARRPCDRAHRIPHTTHRISLGSDSNEPPVLPAAQRSQARIHGR